MHGKLALEHIKLVGGYWTEWYVSERGYLTKNYEPVMLKCSMIRLFFDFSRTYLPDNPGQQHLRMPNELLLKLLCPLG